MNPLPDLEAQASQRSGADCVLHSVENSARRLGIGRTSAFALIRTGRLKAVRLCGRTLVPESAIQALLASLPRV